MIWCGRKRGTFIGSRTLTRMNIQLANVLSDVSGMTREAIIKAILKGERDPHKLAAFRHPRVKASEEQITQSLEGNWQPDLLFVLKQEQDGYEFCLQQMAGAIGSSTTICSSGRTQPSSSSAGREAAAAAQEEERK